MVQLLPPLSCAVSVVQEVVVQDGSVGDVGPPQAVTTVVRWYGGLAVSEML